MTSSTAAPTHYLRPSNDGPDGRRLRPKAPLPPLTSLPPRTHTLTPPLSAQTPTTPNFPPSPSPPPPSHPQKQSPLLSLPPELRLQIYTTLLGGPSVPVHIVRTRTRLASIRCWMPQQEQQQTSRHECLGTLAPNGVFVGWLGPDDDEKSYPVVVVGNDDAKRRRKKAVGMQGMLALLRTCRFVYAEGIGLLYQMPVFVVNDMKVLGWWRESVLAKRFAAVRALDLRFTMRFRLLGWRSSEHEHGGVFAGDDEWQGFWPVVRGMEGLRRLRVRLRCMLKELRWEVEGGILEPLERVRQVPDFEVLVSWRRSEDDEGSAAHERTQRPFRLVRSLAAT